MLGKWIATEGHVGGDTIGFARFVHVWVGDDERPYELVESDLLDYGFLGERRTPAGRTNFNIVIEALSAVPEATQDDRLLRHAGRVPKSIELGFAGAQTTVRMADVVSRLLRADWLEGTTKPATPPV